MVRRSPPRGRRRRPGRRPPRRYPGQRRSSRPQGFTGHGFNAFYNLLLPGLAGYKKQSFWNSISGWPVLGFGLGLAVVGFGLIGPLGGPIGLGAGLVAGGWVAQYGRLYRA